MSTVLTTATAPRKARKPNRTPEQIRHDRYITRAQMIRDARLYKMPAGVKRASFTLNGEHVDMYASKEYAGYGYKVTCDENGYSCGCEQFANRHDGCIHTRASAARASALYHEAKRQNELDTAAVVVPLVVGPEFASDLPGHLDDDMAAQQAWALLSKEEQARRYREMYSGDFYFDVA